jgi:hypothetical protein
MELEMQLPQRRRVDSFTSQVHPSRFTIRQVLALWPSPLITQGAMVMPDQKLSPKTLCDQNRQFQP